MQEIVTASLFFATVAALIPGPLMTLIISETLRHGKISGIAIALAPLLTDLPIMLASIFILSKLQHLNTLLGVISLFGACYLTYLAYENIRIKEVHLQITSRKRSLIKGIITNFLNPNPYIFYFSILAPIAVRGMKANFLYGPATVVIFLGFFVFLNICTAFLADKVKGVLHSRRYVYVIRTLGFILLIFSLLFFRDSLKFFGIIK